jgi:hypothetical protein
VRLSAATTLKTLHPNNQCQGPPSPSTLSSRLSPRAVELERTQISYIAVPPRRRMRLSQKATKFAKATKLDRISGVAQGRLFGTDRDTA